MGDCMMVPCDEEQARDIARRALRYPCPVARWSLETRLARAVMAARVVDCTPDTWVYPEREGDTTVGALLGAALTTAKIAEGGHGAGAGLRTSVSLSFPTLAVPMPSDSVLHLLGFTDAGWLTLCAGQYLGMSVGQAVEWIQGQPASCLGMYRDLPSMAALVAGAWFGVAELRGVVNSAASLPILGRGE